VAKTAEREAVAREAFAAAFEAVCPGVLGNPYIPHWPHPPQALFLGLHKTRPSGGRVMQALYGGAAGGGKSDALLMSLAQMAWQHGEFQALTLRRTYADLALPGAIMDRALAWWKPRGVAWSGETKTFTFPSGARVSFGYLQDPTDHLRYQGAEFHQTCWDELTQFPVRSQFDYVGITRVRRREGCTIPLRTLGASNPGGPGHEWVKSLFVGDEVANIDAELPGCFVSARIQDNPSLDGASYLAGMRHLHPTVRAQLEHGDWRAREPGDYFRREWFGALLGAEDIWPSRDCLRVRWWDLAASEKQDAARTAGVRMARHRAGVRAVEHVVAFRATPGKRDDLIVQTAQADGFGVTVGLEIEGGSGGPAQFEALSGRLRAMGYRVVGARPRVGGPDLTDRERAHMLRQPGSELGKAGRADPVASCLERGYQRRGEAPNTGGPWWGLDASVGVAAERDGLRLFAGSWTSEYLDELEAFPDGPRCDVVDATSGAWAWLEAHPVGGAQAPLRPAPKTVTDPLDQHPDERDEQERGRRL